MLRERVGMWSGFLVRGDGLLGVLRLLGGLDLVLLPGENGRTRRGGDDGGFEGLMLLLLLRLELVLVLVEVVPSLSVSLSSSLSLSVSS